MILRGSRASKLALYALCALAPVVFLVKAAVKPEGDVFPVPSPVPAVPVILLTIGDVTTEDLAGPRSNLPMPNTTALLRDSTQFASSVTCAPGGASFVVSTLASSFVTDQGAPSDATKLRAAWPTLATELKRQSTEKKVAFKTAAFLNSNIGSSAGLQAGFDTLEEGDASTASELVASFDRWLGADTPPRFFVWFDFGEARGAGSSRREKLLQIDAGVGALIQLLHRRRIAGDGVILLASDPGSAGEAPLDKRDAPRAIVSIQLPYEYRSGTVCPVSISTIDLAPTALELLRFGAPPAWRGRGRAKLDIGKFVSTGPAVAGPFAIANKNAWVADQWPRTLWATPSGEILQFIDRSDVNNKNVPPELLQAIVAASTPRNR